MAFVSDPADSDVVIERLFDGDAYGARVDGGRYALHWHGTTGTLADVADRVGHWIGAVDVGPDPYATAWCEDGCCPRAARAVHAIATALQATGGRWQPVPVAALVDPAARTAQVGEVVYRVTGPRAFGLRYVRGPGVVLVGAFAPPDIVRPCGPRADVRAAHRAVLARVAAAWRQLDELAAMGYDLARVRRELRP